MQTGATAGRSQATATSGLSQSERARKQASEQASRHTSKHARQERNAVDVAFKCNTRLAMMLKGHGGVESTERPEKKGGETALGLEAGDPI